MAALKSTAQERRPRRVAVVGATGLVGGTLLQILAGDRLPVVTLRAVTTSDPGGRRVAWRGGDLALEACSDEVFAACELVFLAVPAAAARHLAARAVAAGAVAVDLSEAHRMDAEVPLVVAGVNEAALAAHRGIVASPNCTNVGAALALHALDRAAGLRGVSATTLQAASGAGRRGLAALRAGAGTGPFARPLAGDVLPQCGALDAAGHAQEEERFALELRRILGRPELPVAATCVRVPVAVGHAAALTVETVEPLAPQAARAALAATPGVTVDEREEAPGYATPAQAAGDDAVHVGRVRAGRHPRELLLWQVADNLRRGAALNAVLIAAALR